MKTTIILISHVAILTIGALAQTPAPELRQQRHVRIECRDENSSPECNKDSLLQVMTANKQLLENLQLDPPGMGIRTVHQGLLGPLVKGAPYSGEGITETTQVLADGTRIQRKTSYTIYRDGEGRIRREGTLPEIGAVASASTDVLILDPAAKATFNLDEKTATTR